ncbi:MAG: cellulase family glycosylhydrolase [Eubacteriales bacterium]
MDRKIRFGVNYVPSKNWWYSWVDWDKSSVHEDLCAIAALGMDHIRIHCIWTVFQPNAATVSTTVLDRLHELLDIADESGLDVEVTVLNGFLSGFSFLPSFCLSGNGGHKNIFTHPHIIKAEKLLFSAIAQRIGGHPRFMGFDLGNEMNVLQYSGESFTLEQGDAWYGEIMAHCEAIAPGKLHVNGVDHNPWFSDTSFSREAMSTLGRVTSLHTWIEFTGARSKYGAMDAGCVRLPEYCLELAKAFSADNDRLVWIQEFGASGEWMSSEKVPDFAEATIKNVLSCENLWGVTWWCSHDLDRTLQDFHPLEYDLGLLDVNNNVKPAGVRIKELIRDYKANPIPVVKRTTALVLPEDAFAQDTPFVYPNYPIWRFAERYTELLDSGVSPAIVRECRVGDAGYLKSRGITELIWM